jgi:hypothetical protein
MPIFVPVILVSPKAVITRTASTDLDLTSVIKLDQFKSWHMKRLDNPIRAKDFINILKISSFETIKGLAGKLVALHTPGRIDYIRRFDLAKTLARTTTADEPTMRIEQSLSAKTVINNNTSKRFCADCKTVIADVVANFSLNNFRRFKGQTYCRPCQAKY